MTLRAKKLASGAGWQAHEFVCSAGPSDRPFEEMHRGFSIAAVMSGTFQYRSRAGNAVLAPGALLLGNHGACYQCGHEHGVGDRCIAFDFGQDLIESVAADIPGLRHARFAAPSLPPVAGTVGLLASLETASETFEYEELALRTAALALAATAGIQRRARDASRQDEKRISDALRLIEESAQERVSLAGLARRAGMSRYHFLRTFRRVVGMTPHQYVLRTRLQRAAARIRQSDEMISAIAFDSGFEDLSTFNRRFLQVVGETPGAFRRRVSRRRAPAAPSPRLSTGAASARS